MEKKPVEPIRETAPVLSTTPAKEEPKKSVEPRLQPPVTPIKPIAPRRQEPPVHITPTSQEDTESYIGKNVISIIGIILLVFGLGFGVKYAYDKELLTPKTWIIIGYLIGTGLLSLSFILHKKQADFAAVLLSGAMASFYFLTYFSFSTYHLLSREIAFGMMIVYCFYCYCSHSS